MRPLMKQMKQMAQTAQMMILGPQFRRFTQIEKADR
jgi:hypothetical protein